MSEYSYGESLLTEIHFGHVQYIITWFVWTANSQVCLYILLWTFAGGFPL